MTHDCYLPSSFQIYLFIWSEPNANRTHDRSFGRYIHSAELIVSRNKCILISFQLKHFNQLIFRLHCMERERRNSWLLRFLWTLWYLNYVVELRVVDQNNRIWFVSYDELQERECDRENM